VVVSLTEFTARRARDLPGIVREGVALGQAWWAMPGAVGLVLYVDPVARRGGSVSVWESAEDLRRFVGLPRHAAIMKAYRSRVTVRAASWTADAAPRMGDVLAAREAVLARPGG
jgi:heme-degrading monooxygenase HmoA